MLPESFDFDVGVDIRRYAEKGFGLFKNAAEHGDVVCRVSSNAAADARLLVSHPS